MMKGTPFFRINKYKKFTYTPRYYDEAKEKMEERYEKAKAELGIETDDKERKRIEFRKRRIHQQFMSNRKSPLVNTSRLRFIIIAIFLLVLSYYLLYK